MNEKQQNITAWIIIIGFIFLILAGVYSTCKKWDERDKLCADQFDAVNYSFWDSFETDLKNFRYEEVDETHYNCCWDEVELCSACLTDDEGYYIKRKCRGFVT